jgi:prepilin-type N-terminal cleavage/methylation domain-containing protein
MRNPNSKRCSGGFTLIELMVAMGITAIIITVLVTITGVATDTWTRSRSEIRASRQAKAMLETMARDFESLVARRGNDFEWLHAELESSKLPTVVTGGQGSDAISLTFLTAATDRYLGRVGVDYPDNVGDVSCVSYRLRYMDPIEGGNNQKTSTFVLYRLLVNPDDTFKDLLGKEELDAEFRKGYESRLDEQENFICENVHQFSLAFHVEVTTGTGNNATTETARVVLDSSSGNGNFRVTGRGLETTLSVKGYTEEQLKAGRLKAVEVSISVLSDAGVARMNARDGLKEKDYNRNAYHYSRMIELPGM